MTKLQASAIDPIFEDEQFVPSFLEVAKDLRVSQKDLVDQGFERPVSPNTVSQVLSRKKEKNIRPPAALAVDMVKALANLEGLDQLVEFLLSRSNSDHPNAHDFLYRCVVSAYVDSISSTGIKKKHLDKYLFDRFRNASTEICYVGSIPSRYLDNHFYQVLSGVLSADVPPQVTFIVDSPQHLFWRSFSLDSTRENEARPYQMMLDKYDKIRSIMATQVAILAQEPSRAREHLSVLEADFPLYTDVIKVDDEIYFSHRTSYRQSESVVYRVCKPSDDYKGSKNTHLWDQMTDYVAFLKESAEHKAMVGPLLDETDKISVYSGQGKYQRGSVRRSARKQFPEIETNVVHGLIFDRKGRLCLQYRVSPESGENAQLWDKSFGALRRPGEISLEDTLREAFQREILDDVASRMAASMQRFYEPKTIKYRGQWRGDLEISALCQDDGWSIFSYVDDNQHSQWKFPKQTLFLNSDPPARETILFPNTFASVFILVCDADFARLVDEGSNSSAAGLSPTCRWYDFSSESSLPDDEITRDLATYLDINDGHGYGFYKKLKRIRQKIAYEMKG